VTPADATTVIRGKGLCGLVIDDDTRVCIQHIGHDDDVHEKAMVIERVSSMVAWARSRIAFCRLALSNPDPTDNLARLEAEEIALVAVLGQLDPRYLEKL
jgi:hypothetical protein